MNSLATWQPEARPAEPCPPSATGNPWAERSLRQRLAILRSLRRLIAHNADQYVEAVGARCRDAASVLVSEVIPLCDAIQFLERFAERALRPVHWRGRGRPLLHLGASLSIVHEPLGTVLIIAPSNYPLFLPGVQIVQALAAGNRVKVKPAPNCSAPMALLAQHFAEAGGDPSALTVLGESVNEAQDAITSGGIDRVLLTGSAQTGLAVAAQLAERLVPATMELSGVDAVFVRADADVDLAARSIAYGLTLNGGATCIAPRRLFVDRRVIEAFETRLASALASAPAVKLLPQRMAQVRELVEEAVDAGARPLVNWPPDGDVFKPAVLTDVPRRGTLRLLREDHFAPLAAVVAVDGDEEALALNDQCPYALGAVVFGSRQTAEALARRINAGVVLVNDVIVPHADPRLCFAPRGLSGFGVTRGIEGLLELTRPKAISRRAGRFRPQLLPPHADDEQMFRQALLVLHGGSLTRRLAAVGRIIQIMRRRRK